jgi:PAS domain S-box-containing protein
VNRSVERIWGYDRTELLGKNVKMLMPPEYANNHDTYLASYLKTGDAKIIGSGRKVSGKKKDGNVFPVYLSISETKVSGRHTFTGTVQDLRWVEGILF